MSDKNKCETCKWWEKDQRFGADRGICVNMPQHIVTSANHYCGQWGGEDGARSKLDALIESSEQAATFLERAGDNYGIVKSILRPAIEAAK